jgi:hypothetical protein
MFTSRIPISFLALSGLVQGLIQCDEISSKDSSGNNLSWNVLRLVEHHNTTQRLAADLDFVMKSPFDNNVNISCHGVNTDMTSSYIFGSCDYPESGRLGQTNTSFRYYLSTFDYNKMQLDFTMDFLCWSSDTRHARPYVLS